MWLCKINYQRLLTLLISVCLLCACGFHFQGPTKLVPPLQRIYLKTPDPYGNLAKNLKYYFQMSNVVLVDSPDKASIVLEILRDNSSQHLLAVSGTQRARQYNLVVTVLFQLTDAAGVPILPPQVLTESKVITVQSNLILGSVNEANTYYQQMRRTLAYAMMNRLSSEQVACIVTSYFARNEAPKGIKQSK